VHPVTWLEVFSDIEMTWFLYCAGVCTWWPASWAPSDLENGNDLAALMSWRRQWLRHDVTAMSGDVSSRRVLSYSVTCNWLHHVRLHNSNVSCAVSLSPHRSTASSEIFAK